MKSRENDAIVDSESPSNDSFGNKVKVNKLKVEENFP